MNTLYPPLLQSNQIGKLNYRGHALAVRGAGVLNSAITLNEPGVLGNAQFYDAAGVTDIADAEPIATLAANTASAELDIAFTHGLVIIASPWQTVSVAIQPAATAVFP